MTKEIYIQHPAVNDGTETQLVDVEMTAIYELPPTRGGIRQMADIEMVVPIDSSDCRVLNLIEGLRTSMRLRTGELRRLPGRGDYAVQVGYGLARKADTPGSPAKPLDDATLAAYVTELHDQGRAAGERLDGSGRGVLRARPGERTAQGPRRLPGRRRRPGLGAAVPGRRTCPRIGRGCSYDQTR